MPTDNELLVEIRDILKKIRKELVTARKVHWGDERDDIG